MLMLHQADEYSWYFPEFITVEISALASPPFSYFTRLFMDIRKRHKKTDSLKYNGFYIMKDEPT